MDTTPTNIRDLIRLTGLSRATVSKVLNDRPTKATTRKKVLAAIEATGFVPNRSAVNLVKRRTRTIGVVMQGQSPYPMEVLRAIEMTAKALNYHVVMQCSFQAADWERKAVEYFLSTNVEGIAIVPVLGDENRKFLETVAKRLPLVYIDYHPSGLKDCHYVMTNNRAGMVKVTKHLLECGRQPAYLGRNHGKKRENIALADRQRGYVASMRKADREAVFMGRSQIDTIGNSTLYGKTAVLDWAKRGELPDAIIAGADEVAYGVLAGLAAVGVRPGREVLVAGFDNLAWSAYTVPALTTFAQPILSIGEQAVRAILDLVDGNVPSDKFIQKKISGKLFIRESTNDSQ